MFAPPRASLRSRAIVIAAVPSALIIGLAIVHRAAQGVGVTVGIAYVLIVLLDVALGIAIWIPITLLSGLPALWAAPDITTVLVLAASVGALRVKSAAVSRVLRAHARLFATLAVMILWFLVSLVWERDPAVGESNVLGLVSSGLLMVAIATMAATPRAVRLITLGLVVGGTITVLYGLIDTQVLTPDTGALSSAAASGRRIAGTGGLFDPNQLAAALVPALVLAGAMMGVYRRREQRIGLALAIVVMALGLASTESRGGIIGTLVAVVAALLLFKGRRRQLLLGVVAVAMTLGVWFTVNPAAFTRITNYDGGGSGRTELWRLAWAMTKQQPITGVGYGGFQSQAPRYERSVGPLQYLAVTVEQPKVVHNTYLEVLTEDGIIGLALLLGVIVASLRAGYIAAELFDRRGSPAFAALARAVVVGAIGLLAACFFLSSTTDYVLWLMLALGPALLGIARGPLAGTAQPL
jgi:O-antigen ligase